MSRYHNRNYNRQNNRKRTSDPQKIPALRDTPEHDPRYEHAGEDPALSWYTATDAGNHKMTFGKHRSEPVNQLPLSYLHWCQDSELHDEWFCIAVSRGETDVANGQ